MKGEGQGWQSHAIYDEEKSYGEEKSVFLAPSPSTELSTSSSPASAARAKRCDGRCHGNGLLFSCSRWRLILHMVHSAALFLLFLAVYSFNERLRIFPTMADYGRVRLYNVTRWEEILFLGLRPTEWFQSPPGLAAYGQVGGASGWQTALDWLSSVPYLLHYAIPIVYPLGLCLIGKAELAANFYTLVGLANWLMLPIWYATPTAPPWLAAHAHSLKSSASLPALANGMNATSDAITFAAANAPAATGALVGITMEGCAFARLDVLTGASFFFRLFHRNPVPFAAFPSGHVMWATCIFFVAPPGGRVYLAYVALVIWATLHTCHHYVLDAVGAVLVVVIAKQIIVHLRKRGHRHSICMCDNYGMLCSVVC